MLRLPPITTQGTQRMGLTTAPAATRLLHVLCKPDSRGRVQRRNISPLEKKTYDLYLNPHRKISVETTTLIFCGTAYIGMGSLMGECSREEFKDNEPFHGLLLGILAVSMWGVGAEAFYNAYLLETHDSNKNNKDKPRD